MTTHRCPDDKGIGDKDVGFAQFASPKKRSGAASDGHDGFAQVNFEVQFEVFFMYGHRLPSPMHNFISIAILQIVNKKNAFRVQI